MPETNLKQTAQRDSGRLEAPTASLLWLPSAPAVVNGARSFLPTTSKKPTVAAMEEVPRGCSTTIRRCIAMRWLRSKSNFRWLSNVISAKNALGGRRIAA
jgi:hypothetical protein